MERINFADFKKEALKDAEVREEYEKLKPLYELRKQLITLYNLIMFNFGL